MSWYFEAYRIMEEYDIPKYVVEDVTQRLEDWIEVEGHKPDDDYCKQQVRYLLRWI